MNAVPSIIPMVTADMRDSGKVKEATVEKFAV
jgi:hypothetical protein